MNEIGTQTHEPLAVTTAAPPAVGPAAPDFGDRELTGTVRAVRPFEGWAILTLDGSRSVIGEWDEDEMPTLGCRYRFWGSWRSHERWGLQFRTTSHVLVGVEGQTGVTAYLSRSGLGLTRVESARLWRTYGADAVNVLRTDPARTVADGVLDDGKAHTAAGKLAEDLDDEPTKIALFELFASHGIPRGAVRACIRTWGADAPRVIRRDPFKLITNDIPGVGFRRADSIYTELGLPPHRLKRQMLAGWHALHTSGSGNTWEWMGAFYEAVRKAVGGLAAARLDDAVRLGVRARWLRLRTDAAATGDGSPGVSWIAEASNAAAEAGLAGHVRRVRRHRPLWPSLDDDTDLSEHQRERAAAFAASGLAILAGTPGCGKAQPLDAKVLTPTGWKRMGDIEVGDQVVEPSGLPSVVTGVFNQGEKEIYRVTFSDGSATECCANHLWLTQTRQSRKNAQRNGYPLFRAGKVRSAREIADTLEAGDGHKNHYIPMVRPVEFEAAGKMPVDPYLLGVLLGNGCFRGNAVKFTSNEAETVAEVCELLPDGLRIVDQYRRIDFAIRKAKGYSRHAVIDYLKKAGLYGQLSTHKFIPQEYRFARVADRVRLLQGLLDTDGSVSGSYNLEFSTSSAQLADDVLFLVQSLGGRSRITSRIPIYTYAGERKEGERNYRLHISLPPEIEPFRLRRKLERYKPRSKYLPSRHVVSVESVGIKPARCIAVSAPTQLYVTDEFIVTHNTYTAAVIIRRLIAQLGEHLIRVCAPTGKAAVRVSEMMGRYNLPIKATTIHGLLEVQGVDDRGGFLFGRDQTNPIDAAVVVVDEASMLDTDLAASLFAAIPAGGNVLLIGDQFQLPPVGHGAPLRDLIAAGVPTGELSEIRRNAGAIVRACRSIKDGKAFAPVPRIDVEAGENLANFPADGDAAQADAVLALLGEMRRRAFDPVWDVQVLVPRNGGSLVGRKSLNERLQAVLNPVATDAGEVHENATYRVGDKVICLKNSEAKTVDPATGKPDGAIAYLANGDMGRVMSATKTAVVVKFAGPERVVSLTTERRRKAADVDGKGDAATGDDASATGGGRASDLDLAYAITVHKSQGSEWPVVIVVLDENAGPVACREWIYTGVSRASRLCVTVGPMRAAAKMIGRVGLAKRKTFLRELVTETTK